MRADRAGRAVNGDEEAVPRTVAKDPPSDVNPAGPGESCFRHLSHAETPALPVPREGSARAIAT
jgi:hypothetical protein